MNKKFLILCSLCLSLCGTPSFAGEITVSGAASLKNAFNEIVTIFVKKNPDIKVNTNYASSNALLKQMQEGAPVDVFATADQATMDTAQKGKLIKSETRRDFALNDLVMVVPKDNPGKVSKPEDMLKPEVKHIAVGEPKSVPAGRYAKDSLTSSHLWDKITAKIVFGNNVRQVADYVKRGEAEAGFVYHTDALQYKNDIKIVKAMTGHQPVLYPIAVASTGKNSADGQKFVNFVCSKEGMDVLAKFGFAKPAK